MHFSSLLLLSLPPTIITSNLSFLKWQEIFRDPVLTAELPDRLTHKSHVLYKKHRRTDEQVAQN
ncbi:ATP-binding protein [Paraliobacillus sediminis]|uniref:ATP-binding protein n=1 Tax=Paraliobacillus sediminis TaxID=1885916 RepID=UPI0030843E2D